MQRERSALDSFHEPIDLNQGSHPETNSVPWDNILNPGEDIVAVSEGNVSHMDVAQRFSGWDRGESSSRSNIIQEDHMSGMSLDWSSFHSLSGCDSRLQDLSPNVSSDIHIGSHVPAASLVSNNSCFNLNTNTVFLREYEHRGGVSPSVFKSVHPESGHPSSFSSGSSDLGGSSCKRKALDESSSRQFYCGGSSSSNPPMQDQFPVGPGNLSSGALSLSLTNQSAAQLNQSSDFGLSGLVPRFLPSSNVSRDFGSIGDRISMANPFDVPREASTRSYGICIAPSSSRNNSLNQSLVMHMDEGRAVSQCAGPRSGSLSSSFHGETSASRNSRRTNPGYGMTISAPEAGISIQDNVDWSFTPSRNESYGRIPRARSSGLWLPPPVQTCQNHHRLSEAAPWNPNAYVESGVRRSHISLSTQNQHNHSRLAPSSVDDVSGGSRRHRLIRQVLNAMRRGAYLQDVMLVDRHEDMRLDVDNMSYEELLALEEMIGNVSSGMSEEKIERKMKRRKHEEGTRRMEEPCCICQEEYVGGDEIGMVDCGHEFHSDCIKQWLMLKNLCPICKMEALHTS